MGGFGSGRIGYKQKAEHTKSLDVNRLRRERCLTPGRRGYWVWSGGGEETGRIAYYAKEKSFDLDYRVRQYGGDWETVTQSIPLTYAECHYGGTRPYFKCNGVVNGRHCLRRVGKVFAGGKYFLCRHCYGISYSSQSEARYDRMLRRANKLRIALGGEPGTVNSIAPKPKGMWQRTYQRKWFEIEWCENQADRLFIAKYAHLLSTEEREMFAELP
jgi:hypothetical protein